MKKLIISSAVLFSLFSCNKSNNPPPPPDPPANDSLLKSYSIYNPRLHTKTIETFEYNSSSQIASIHGYGYDSTGGTPLFDSGSVSFLLTDTATPPSAYDIVTHDVGDPPAGKTEHHLLQYDNQKRLTLDSVTISSFSSYSTQHYSYDDWGNSIVQWLYSDLNTPGYYSINVVDTMFIQDENIYTDINYSAVSGDFYRLYSYQYSTYLNPLYNPTLANSLGCMFVFNYYGDYRSKNLPNQYTDQEAGAIPPSVTLDFVWTLDAAGRVVKGIATDNSSGQIEQIINYTY